MILGDFSPRTIESAMYTCVFSSCSDCPLNGCKEFCAPEGETSQLFAKFSDELVKVVLGYRGSEVANRIVRKAIVSMYEHNI